MFERKEAKKPISARVAESLRDKIDFIASDNQITVSEVVEAWLLIGLKEYEKPQKKKKVQERKAPDFDSDSFEAFYSLYPKKVAKQEAEKAWKKLNPNQFICEQIQQHLDHAYKNTEKKFIPNPSTYLNQGRWADEVIDSTAGS